MDGAVQTIKNLDAALEELEPEILSLTRDNVGSYQHIYRTLLSFEVPLHKIVASTMNKDEEVAAMQRDDIRHPYYWLLVCFVGMASSAILLVILLFREINNVKGLLAIAHAAEFDGVSSPHAARCSDRRGPCADRRA